MIRILPVPLKLQCVNQLGNVLAKRASVAATTQIGRDNTRLASLERRLDRPHHGIGRFGKPKVLQHHLPCPDHADRVRDTLARDIGRASVHRFEQTRPRPLRVDVARRRDADRAGACWSKIRQDVTEEVAVGSALLRDLNGEAYLPTTTSNISGRRTKKAVRMSIWYLSVRTSGYFLPISATRVSQYGIEMLIPLLLVALVRCRLGRD